MSAIMTISATRVASGRVNLRPGASARRSSGARAVRRVGANARAGVARGVVRCASGCADAEVRLVSRSFRVGWWRWRASARVRGGARGFHVGGALGGTTRQVLVG